MFQLTKEEWDSLRFQIGILDVGRGKYTKYLPYAFTEQGLAMLSGILNSDIAIYTNISIMRAFVAIRQNLPIVSTQKELEELKQRVTLGSGESVTFTESDADELCVRESRKGRDRIPSRNANVFVPKHAMRYKNARKFGSFNNYVYLS